MTPRDRESPPPVFDPGPPLDARAETDPIHLFQRWHKEAASAGILQPSAAALATADASGRPSVRMLLTRGFNGHGIAFFTNLESRKALELEGNPRASMVFWWDRLIRQVRVEGTVERLAREESDEHFGSRPRASKIAVWASPQSQLVDDRDELERRYDEAVLRFAGGKIPRPPFWGGYRLVPEAFEFWQGRDSRLHDRLLYRKSAQGWRVERLAP